MKIKTRLLPFRYTVLVAGIILFINSSVLALENHQIPSAQTDSGYYTSFDKTKIWYEVQGTGQPVLLLHGFIVNSSSWKYSDLYRQLLDQGYRVILIDLRGNGKSGHPHSEDAYAHDAESRDITGLLDFLKIKSYDLVGYSRGSIIAARVLRNDPRVHKVVIGGMGDAFTDTSWKLPKALYQSLIHAPAPEFEGLKNYVRREHLDSVCLAYMQKQQPFTSTAALRKIKQPVLLIRGDRDSTNGSAKALQILIPHSVYVQVPGDHNASSSTKAFADRVMAFLKP